LEKYSHFEGALTKVVDGKSVAGLQICG
jgi:hypothetical protein